MSPGYLSNTRQQLRRYGNVDSTAFVTTVGVQWSQLADAALQNIPGGLNAIHVLQSGIGDVQSVFSLVFLPGLGNGWGAAIDARLRGEPDGHPKTHGLTLEVVLGRRSAPVPRNRCHGEVRHGVPSMLTTAKQRSKMSPIN